MNIALRLVVVALLVSLSATAPPARAEVRLTGLNSDGGFATISIVGEISDTDGASFKKLVAILSPTLKMPLEIELNSSGGSVPAAMEIGEAIREGWLWTIVSSDKGARCYSACVLILAAGAVRFGADQDNVGIHRPYFAPKLFASLKPDQARAKYAELERLVSTYLAKMGMSEELFREMIQVPSGKIRILRQQEMEALSLVGWDPAYEEWVHARQPETP